MQPKTLDHVAFWVADRDPIAEFLTAHLGVHVVDRQENFTLLGSDARRFKFTLFDAEGPRDPGVFGRSVADFHRETADVARDWPDALLTLSTHDTKRSADVRARLHVLSEIPGPWGDCE